MCLSQKQHWRISASEKQLDSRSADISYLSFQARTRRNQAVYKYSSEKS